MLTKFINKKDFIDFISIYKRTNNILKKASKEFSEYENFNLNIETLLPEEKNFYDLLNDDIFQRFETFKDLQIILNNEFLLKLAKTLNDFFNNLMIMDENLEKRYTRLSLLYKFVEKFNDFDFEALQLQTEK